MSPQLRLFLVPVRRQWLAVLPAMSVLAIAGGMRLATGGVPQGQHIWFVNDDGDPAAGCTSWPDACPELQTALSLATAGDQIWVAAGTYRPDYDVEIGQHTGDREATFRLITGVEMYGGFAGTETQLEKRAGLFDETILSGDIGGASNADNSYHVVTGNNTIATAVIDGFTVTAGNADGKFPNNSGAGMWLGLPAGSPTIVNCRFSDNSAAGGGGGILCTHNSNPVLINCTLSDNVAGHGGGIACRESSPTLTRCTFIGNSADGGVGGGGMHNTVLSDPVLTNCRFIGNTASLWGGGMSNIAGSSPTISNCTFAGNAGAEGGAMSNAAGCNPTVTNCTFSGNLANFGGGINNRVDAHPALANCILWGNTPDEILDLFDSISTVNYSDVQGGWPGEGNIDADPLFVDPDGSDDNPGTFDDNNYRLGPGSPGVDAGDSDAIPDCILDLDGHERFVDDPGTEDSGTGGPPVVDMGAYEFGGQPLPDCTGNALPDECEPDCNGNGAADTCDLADGTSEDCNGDGIPDECEPAGVEITQQPVSQEVEPGDLVFFSVGAEGLLLEYQWRKDGADMTDTERILGVQSAGLVILEVESSDAGKYDCVVTTEILGCQVVSDPATLTVLRDCSADVDGDGNVGPFDLALLLGSWGPCAGCPADFNSDGVVGAFDLALLLGAWGPCP